MRGQQQGALLLVEGGYFPVLNAACRLKGLDFKSHPSELFQIPPVLPHQLDRCFSLILGNCIP